MNLKSSLQILRHPLLILAAMTLGIYIGLYQKQWVEFVAPVGSLFLSALKMCVYPILIGAVSSSLGKLIRSRSSSQYLLKMVFIFMITLVIISAIGVTIAAIGQPGGNLDLESTHVLGSVVREQGKVDLEVYLHVPYVDEMPSSRLLDFFLNMVPENIFKALSSGSSLQVLIFAIVFGLAAGFIPKQHSDQILDMMHSVYVTFSLLVGWLMYVLPFGLVGMIAGQFSNIGIDFLLSMTRFFCIFLIAVAFVLVVETLVIWRITGLSCWRVITALKEPIILALGTSNGIATLPSALDAMHNKLGYDRELVDLVLPLGITIGRFGHALYFTIAAIFVAQLYDVPLGLPEILFIAFTSILAAMATAGTTGIISIPMIGIVLGPLGLPIEAVIVLFFIIDPIVVPFRTLIMVYTSCLTSVLIIPRENTNCISKLAQAT